MKNLRKIFASAMVTAMLATMGVSAFATTGTPHGLENLGEKYGFTVEYAGEIDGDALYETSRNRVLRHGQPATTIGSLIGLERENSVSEIQTTCTQRRPN